MKFRLSLLTLSLSVTAASAQAAEPVQIETHGVYRPRVELDHRFGTSANAFVTHRARVSVGLSASDWRVYLEPQDVRTWGFESNTAVQEGRLDLHQGYAEYKGGDLLQVRIGRQEVSYLNQRLIGSLDWAQTGRSFDALRVSGKSSNIGWDGFAAIVSNASGKDLQDAGVAGLTAKWSNAGRTTAIIAVHDWTPAAKNYRWTVGPYAEGRIVKHVTYRAEGYYQQGHKPRADAYKAYMVGAQLGLEPLGVAYSPRLALGYDRLSGNDGQDWVPFDTLYATNHKFYGYMDFFTNLPVHTGGAGLQDLYVSAAAMLGAVDCQLTFHRFLTAGELRTADDLTFGNEADLIATWKISPNAALQGGYTVFAPEKGFEILKPKAPPYPTWSYAMLTVSL